MLRFSSPSMRRFGEARKSAVTESESQSIIEQRNSGSKLLDQMELQLEEFETALAEDDAAADAAAPEQGQTTVRAFTRAKPLRGPLPAHLPRERVVLPSPSQCPCCGGRLAKLGESVTETLECVPRTFKVIQTVREKLSCRACETITQPPAAAHRRAGRRGGPPEIAMIDSTAVRAHGSASGAKGGSRARGSAARATAARPKSTPSATPGLRVDTLHR